MTSDGEALRRIGEWLEDGRTRLPDFVLDAVLEQLPSHPQRRTSWLARRNPTMTALVRPAIAAAAVVVVAIAGINLLGAVVPAATEATPSSITASPSFESLPPSPSLPRLGLPGNRSSPAGEYGWDGRGAGMHHFVGDRETADLIFAVECVWPSDDGRAVPVRVAGFDGLSIEPWEPIRSYNSPVGDEVTRAYALDVDGTRLCVFVTWHATTTDDELAAVIQILDTIRAEPIARGWLRVNFVLNAGWDRG